MYRGEQPSKYYHLKNMSYKERLEKLKMPTLNYRRQRGDMIETFKIANEIYDKDY